MRIKLSIKRGDLNMKEVALINSGYEAPTPQLLISINLSKKLGLWPPEKAFEVSLDTAGGPLAAWYYPRAVKVKALAEDAESKEVEADVIVSPLAEEPLISDKLAGELEIAVEDFSEGL